jgi:hypothetical protein
MKENSTHTVQSGAGGYAHRSKILLLFSFVLFLSITGFAGTKTWTGAASTDWFTAANWSPSGVPASGDDVVIPANPTGARFPLFSTGSTTVRTLVVQAAASFSQTGGSFIANGANWTVAGTINVSGGSFICANDITITNGGVINLSGAGIIHMAPDLNTDPTDKIIIDQGGIMNQSGGSFNIKDFTLNTGSPAGVFNQSGGTVNLYHDLRNTGVYAATGGTIHFATSGAGGSFPAGGSYQFFNVLVDVGVNAQFDNNTVTIYVAGDFTNNSTTNNVTNRATFIMNGSGNQVITSVLASSYSTFGNLTINKTGGVASLASNIVISDNLNITAGTFSLGTYTCNRKTGGDIMTIGATGVLQLGGSSGGQIGSNFPINYNTITLAAGSTVEYNGGNGTQQTIYTGLAYSNLVLSNSSGTGSATKITTANLTVNTGLVVNSAAVLTPGAAYTVGGTGILSGSGTAQVTRTAATADFLSQYSLAAYRLDSLTVDYSATTAQSVNAINYGHLKISGARGTTSVTFPASGTVGISGVFSPVASFTSGNYITTGSSIHFNGTGDQSIPSFPYVNLLTSGSGSTKTATGLLNITTSVSVGNNVTMDMGTNALSSAIAITNNGNIKTQNTSANPLPAGRTWPGFVEYNAPAGGQTIVNGSYSTLTINTGSGTNTLDGATQVSSVLNLAAGTLLTGTNTLSIGNAITRTSGVIDASAGTVNFNGSSPQTIVLGMFTGNINNLTISNNAGVTTADNLTLTGTLNLAAGSFDIGTKTLTIKGNLTRTNGSLRASLATIIFNGTAVQSIAPGVFATAVNNLTINNNAGVTSGADLTVGSTLALTAGTFSIGSSTLTINGNITRTGGFVDAAAGTLVFGGTTAQSIAPSSFNGAIYNLSINNAAGVTTAANATVSNTLNLGAGIFSIGTTTFTLGGNITRSAGLLDVSSGTLVFAGSGAQSIALGAFTGMINNLTVNNTAGVTTNADATITGTLSLDAGPFSIGTTTLTLKGNIARTAGSVNAASGFLVFNGTSAQSIAANVFAGSIKNLTISNTAGVTTAADATITGTLSLANGTYTIAGSTHTITGAITTTGGTMDASSGTLVFNGSVAQSIPSGSVSTNINNLTVNNAAGLTINANHTIESTLVLQAGSLSLNGRTLTLGGTISGTGLLKGSAASGLTVASSTIAGTLNFDQSADGVSNALASLTVSSGVATLGGKLNLYTVLNVSGGTLDLAAKSVVLKSLSTNTARVAPVTGTINNATNVTVERWFPNDGRKYRFITSGVTTTTSIKANWMEGVMNTSFCSTCNVNPKPGYGTQISGTGGNANGFDATATNNASLFTYNQNTGAWAAVTSTAGTLSANTPYMIFIRGDRSVDMTYPGSIPVLLPGSGTTLRATGSLPIGQKTFSSLAGAGRISFVPNPYPSPISWSSLFSNNSSSFENYYNYFEPKIGQRGSYVTVTSTGLNSNVNSAATEQIQSGQSFFVTTKAGVTAPSIIIREQDKSVTSNINVFRTERTIEKFYTSLNFSYSANQKFNADGALVAYGSQFSNNLDGNDAVQIASWDEDVAILRGGKSLSIETRNQLSEGDTIPLTTARLKTGVNYEWQFTPQNMGGHSFGAFLVDKYLKKETPVSLVDNTYIPFTLTSDAASAASDRFFVVFKTVNTLPVTFTTVKAYQISDKPAVRVEWQTANELALSGYEVERSFDGQSFTKLQALAPKGGVSNDYAVNDNAAANGDNYYRIKSIDRNGAIKYSNIALVRISAAKQGWAVYPNPFTGTEINLQFVNKPQGSYYLQVWNSAGALAYSRQIDWNGGSGSQALQLPEVLGAGVYNLRVKGAEAESRFVLVKE